MVDDIARDRAIYHALKAADEVAAALQTHLIEEHGADPDRAAPKSASTNSLKILMGPAGRFRGMRMAVRMSPADAGSAWLCETVLKLLRQARERLGQGLRAVDADNVAEPDGISLRNQ